RSEILKGDAVTQEKVKNHPKVTMLYNAVSSEVLGNEKFVTGLKYKDAKTGEEKQLAVDGVFVEIGSLPNAEFVKGIVTLNAIGEIVTDPKTQHSSQVG
ncbi:hypothetical protein LRR18_17625, partial [Mangrovimonas sp. AS39]|uniref:FAD-dependent oxidoreductase n=1 Tax=Mangrovimonas futianensis TaxID=2895523 RepID=UPI00300C1C7B|nr:hypothetical protein [Mangrovimonas futianensis]